MTVSKSEMRRREFSNMFLIESIEHTHGEAITFWKPHRMGYTVDVDAAGRYTPEEAKEIVENANRYRPENDPNERMWSESDVYNGKAGRVMRTVIKR